MKRTVIACGYLILVGFALFNLAACSPLQQARAEEPESVMGRHSRPVDEPDTATPAASTDPSCVDPAQDMSADCRAQAERILASTVRLEFHGPGGGIGHATVVGGRYLITHNHYPVSGDALSRGGDGLLTAISVFKSSGDIILLKAPLAYFSVAFVAPEALVLDFKSYGGVGFFDSVGIPSAAAEAPAGPDMEPGNVVAQIDWDGATSFVRWTRITAVRMEGDVPVVELASFVEQGASGGGVFYNGRHIANNESRRTDRDAASGQIVRQYSVAALNTGSLVAAALNATEVASVGN